MSEKKNDVLALPDISTSPVDNSSSSTTIILHNGGENQVINGNKPKWSKKGQRVLTLDHTVHSLAIKCYEEQMPGGWDAVCDVIRQTSGKDFHVVAIRHYKEIYADEGHFWKSAYEKNHFHIIFRCVDRKKRMRVGSVLRQLGIVFRKGLDDNLWKDHGVETIGNFGGYTLYLTHETEDAIRDGKELYDRSEVVSNLTEEELDEIREGYVRLSNGKRKASDAEMVALDEEAYQRGYELKNFDDWYHDLPLGVRANSKMRLVRETYEYGIDKRIEEKKEMVRLFVYIQSPKGYGKTGSTLLALSGKKVLHVKNGDTGKFDNLKADYDAIVMDDCTCDNPLGLGDNYVCRAYRRNKNSPPWTGKYFIVLSNLIFEDWLKECGVKNAEHIEAAFDRVYLCSVKERPDGTKCLSLESPSTRGTVATQMERADMFMDFQKKFNEAIAKYIPSEELVDYAGMKDPEKWTRTEKTRMEEKAAQEAQGIILRSSYNKDTERITALKSFGEWFWTNPTVSPWAGYVKAKYPARLGKEDALHFIRTLSAKKLMDTVSQYIDYKMVQTFDIEFVRDVIEWTIDPTGE